MFAVEEYLIMTKEINANNNYKVIESCSSYYSELAGFFVCFTEQRKDAIIEYVNQKENQKYIGRRISLDPVSGLDLLKRVEGFNSYTEQFVKYYGGIEGVLDAFSNFIAAESETNTVTDDKAEDVTSFINNDNVINESQEQYVDDSLLGTLVQQTEEETMYTTTQDSLNNYTEVDENSSYAQEVQKFPVYEEFPINEFSKEPICVPTVYQDPNMMQQLINNNSEACILLKQIAAKVGILEEEHILSIADIKLIQKKIDALKPDIAKEALIATIGLAETKSERSIITKFLENYTSYLYDNKLI